MESIKAEKLDLKNLITVHSEKMLGFLEAKQEMHRGNIRLALKKMPQTNDSLYYNNQGALNIRLQKYAMASFFLSKAIAALN